MRTIRGYRTAIAGALKFSGRYDMGKAVELSDLLKSLDKDRPVRVNPVPKWDLSFVLWSLAFPPFEPISVIPLKMLTWKAVFLLLLASGARRSELHAVAFDSISHTDNWRSVTLHPITSFVYKTQVSRGQAKNPKVINIPALGPILSPDMTEEKALCPARTLKCYMARTKPLRNKNQKLLFVSYSERHKHKEIHKNTLSGWVRKLVTYCYQNASDKAAEIIHVRAHDLRGMAASIAFKGCAEMEDILQAGSWATPNTFISHYLKDAVITPEGLQKLGPIVAAQTVITS